MILILVVEMYLYQQKRKFFPLDHLMSHKFEEVTSERERLEKKYKILFFLKTSIDSVSPCR